MQGRGAMGGLEWIRETSGHELFYLKFSAHADSRLRWSETLPLETSFIWGIWISLNCLSGPLDASASSRVPLAYRVLHITFKICLFLLISVTKLKYFPSVAATKCYAILSDPWLLVSLELGERMIVLKCELNMPIVTGRVNHSVTRSRWNTTKQYSKSANYYAICSTLYHASGSACWSADKVTNSLTLVTCKYSPVTLWTCFALSFPYAWDPWNEEREPRVVRFCCRAVFRREWHSRKILEHEFFQFIESTWTNARHFGVLQAESGGNPLC